MSAKFSNLSIKVSGLGENDFNFFNNEYDYRFYETGTVITFSYDIEGATSKIKHIDVFGGIGIKLFDQQTYINTILCSVDTINNNAVVDKILIGNGNNDSNHGMLNFKLGMIGNYFYKNGEPISVIHETDFLFKGFTVNILFEDGDSGTLHFKLPKGKNDKQMILSSKLYFTEAPTGVIIKGGRQNRSVEFNGIFHHFSLSDEEYIDGIWLYLNTPATNITNESGLGVADGCLISCVSDTGDTRRIFKPFDFTKNMQSFFINLTSLSIEGETIIVLVRYANSILYNDEWMIKSCLDASETSISNTLKKGTLPALSLSFSSFLSQEFIDGEDQFFTISQQTLESFSSEGIICYNLYFENEKLINDYVISCNWLKENEGRLKFSKDIMEKNAVEKIKTEVDKYDGNTSPKREANITITYEHPLSDAKNYLHSNSQELFFIIKHRPKIGREILNSYENTKNNKGYSICYTKNEDNKNIYIPKLKKGFITSEADVEYKKIQATQGYTLIIKDQSEEESSYEFSINKENELLQLNSIIFDKNFDIWRAEAKVRWEYKEPVYDENGQIVSNNTLYSCESDFHQLQDLYCAYFDNTILTPRPLQDSSGNYIIFSDFGLEDYSNNFAYTNFFLEQIELKWSVADGFQTKYVVPPLIKGQFIYLENASSDLDGEESRGILELSFTLIDGETIRLARISNLDYSIKRPSLGCRRGGIIINPPKEQPLTEGAVLDVYVPTNTSGYKINFYADETKEIIGGITYDNGKLVVNNIYISSKYIID